VKKDNLQKSYAFTLAETLIALMIIGLVAALTVPVIMSNIHGRAYRTQYLKTVSILTQAATASFANDSYDFSGASAYYGDLGSPTETYNLPDGAEDGNIVGPNTPLIKGDGTHSDLHIESNSIFHLLVNNLNLKNSAELTNYAVGAVNVELNCAGRATDGKAITIDAIGKPAITSSNVKNNLHERMYKSQDVLQGSGGLANLCDGRSVEQGGINQGRMVLLDDGAVFTYDPSQTYCLESNPCYGYIDVNGPAGPNRVVACTEGEDSYIATYGKNAQAGMLLTNCTVKTNDISDIYPVLFYNQTVKPASWAAKSIQFSLASNQVPEASQE